MNILFSCIGRRGYIADFFKVHLRPSDQIIGTSNSEFTTGFSACDFGVLIPDISSPEYVPAMIELCRLKNISGMLSFFDPDINVLSGHLDEFRSLGVMPIMASKEVSNICFDKYQTFLFLKAHGFNCLETFCSLEESLAAMASGRLTFPLVVKERFGYGSHNIFFVANVQELTFFFNYVPDMIIQQRLCLPEYHLDICNDMAGNVLAVVPKRKISMRAGETDQAETCSSAELMDYGLRLGKELGKRGHVGPLDVDCFFHDGKVTIMEINPRFGGGYPSSHLAGADFPALIVGMLRGEPVEPKIGEFRSGIIMMKEYGVMGGERIDMCRSIIDLNHKDDHEGAASSGEDSHDQTG
ncbi:MAG: ATP-grasp domain-containing protein [Candidatus Sulfobium sp.]|jgi:carbamoyl-phosphate synthase large subunit